MRRAPLYGASRTWLYPSAPPPFAPLGNGSLENYALDAPMNVVECAEASLRDRGCKQRIPGRGWLGERENDNRFSITVRMAGAVWREITTVAAMGREEKARRRALRVKVSYDKFAFRGAGAGAGGNLGSTEGGGVLLNPILILVLYLVLVLRSTSR